MPTAEFQLRGERDRPWRLHLDGPLRPTQAGLLPCLLERVDVLGEQADRAAGHGTAPCGDAVTAGHGVDGDVDQQRTGPSDEIGPDSAGGQLDQMWQSMQLPDHDLGGLPRRCTRPGSDAGARGEGAHGRSEITIVSHFTNTIRHTRHTR